MRMGVGGRAEPPIQETNPQELTPLQRWNDHSKMPIINRDHSSAIIQGEDIQSLRTAALTQQGTCDTSKSPIRATTFMLTPCQYDNTIPGQCLLRHFSSF